ncbi:MAG: DMT family transporter [Geminicoccaceae bacterium]
MASLPLSSGTARARRYAQWTPVLPHVLLFVLGTVWGLQFTLLKVATDASLDEASILAVAMGLMATIFLAATAFTRTWFRPTWQHVRFFLLSGLFGFVLPLGGVILAAREISAGLIVLFEALTPVFALAIAAAFRTEPVTRRRILAIAFGLLSVLAVGGPAAFGLGGISLVGLGFALFVPAVCALDCFYVAAFWPSDLRPLQVVTGEAVAGAFLSALCLLSVGDPAPLFHSWTIGHWALALFVPISVLEAYLYFYLVRRSGAVFVSLGSLISLFAGIFWGIVLIGETHPPTVWLAVGLATLALYLALRKD